MLLPALQQAREKARRINCAGNLKQIGLALRSYEIDFNGYFPNGTGWYRASGNAPVPLERKYFDNTDKTLCGGFELLRGKDYLADYAVYVCPSSTAKIGDAQESLGWDSNNLSYGYENGLSILNGDNRMYGAPDSAIAADLTGDGTSSNSGNPNHTKYGNILYVDGHVTGIANIGWFGTADPGPGFPSTPGTIRCFPNTIRNLDGTK